MLMPVEVVSLSPRSLKDFLPDPDPDPGLDPNMRRSEDGLELDLERVGVFDLAGLVGGELYALLLLFMLKLEVDDELKLLL